MKIAITNLTPYERFEVRNAASLACRFWPNAWGEENTSHHIRNAFEMLRRETLRSGSVECAASILRSDAYRYKDM